MCHWRGGADNGLVPLVHAMPRSGNEALWRLWHLAEQFPSVPMVAVGALATWDQQQAILAEPGRAKNIVYDTSGLANGAESLLALAECLGPERLVFGSGAHCDEPLDAAHLAEELAQSRLPEPLKRAVLWDNAARLFNLGSRP
jgi:predicted TIM-barrel fold metal-dependent hydrolase